MAKFTNPTKSNGPSFKKGSASISNEINKDFSELSNLLRQKVDDATTRIKDANTSDDIKAIRDAINAPLSDAKKRLDKAQAEWEANAIKKEATEKIRGALSDFVGALRQSNLYNDEEGSGKSAATVEEATEETTTTNSDGTESDDYVEFSYVPGDTFGQKIIDLGLATDNGLWGDNGDVAYYTRQLIDQGALDERGNVKLGQTFRLKRRK